MKKKALWFIGAVMLLGCIGQYLTVSAAANPPALGGTGTSVIPTNGQILIGNGAGTYTPAVITPGTDIIITNNSGSVTLAVKTSDFLPSSTVYVATVNGQSGAITITSSTLGVATNTLSLFNGNGFTTTTIQAVLNALSATGLASYNSSTGVFSVSSSSLNLKSASQFNFSDFLPSSTVYVASVNGQSGAVTVSVPATTTVNGVQSAGFKVIGDGTTATSTVNGSTTTFSIINTGNWSGTWQGANSSTFYLASNPSAFISGNQTITFKASGDATGTATGATSITDSLTVTGLQGHALPALATGTLKYTGGAWTLDGNTYLLSGVNVTTTAPLGGGGPLTSAGITLTCATCLTGNQTITLTGAVTGSGATSIATTFTTSTLYGLFSGSGPISFNASTGAIAWTNSNGYITLASLSASAPLAYNSSTGQFTCPSCVTVVPTSTITINGIATSSFNFLASGPGLTVASSGNSITYNFSSSSLNLGSASTHPSTDFLASTTVVNTPSTTIPTTYVSTFNGATGTVTGINSINNGTGTYSILPGTNITISTSSTSTTINATGGGGANNATGTIDEQAIFNATNTLISSQPDVVPSNFATAGCAGSSTATTINGCIQAIIKQEQANGASAATILVTHNVSTSTYPSPILLNTNGFPVQLECTAGVQLQYGGSQGSNQSGAIVFNFGNPTGHPALAEGEGCDLLNGSTWVYAGLSNNATDTGIYFGGTQGAVGINWMGNINGFGINYVMGQNAYMDAFTGTSSGGNGGVITTTGTTVNGSTTVTSVGSASTLPIGAYLYGTGIPIETTVVSETSSSIVMSNAATASNSGVSISVEWGSLGQYDTAANSGERALLAGTYTDPGNSSATDALFLADGALASWFCSGVSLDDAQIHVGFSNGQVSCAQTHIEDSDYSQYGAYIPIYAVSSQYTYLSLTNISIAQDSGSAGTTFPLIVKHGVNFYANGVFINNYGGAAIPAFVDHSLNNGSESEQICDIQASGGTGLTNIVAGGGGNTYNQARGLGCSMDVANSYTIDIYPNGNNTNNIDSGNSTIGTFDHSGDWTLGINGSSVHSINGNITFNNNATVDGNLEGFNSVLYPPTANTSSFTLGGSSATNQVYSGTGAATGTLFAVSGHIGYTYTFINRGTGILAIAATGTDSIYANGATSTVYSVPVGGCAALVNDSVYWTLAYTCSPATSTPAVPTIATTTKSVYDLAPSSTDDLVMFYTETAFTLKQVDCINDKVAGNTATFNITWGANRNSTTSNAFTSNYACTATTTIATNAINGSTTIPAGSIVRAVFSAASSTGIYIDIKF